jgi:hypothetical protein
MAARFELQSALYAGRAPIGTTGGGGSGLGPNIYNSGWLYGDISLFEGRAES